MTGAGGDSWQVGDLALCVKQGEWRHSISGSVKITPMRAGQIHVVRRYAPCPVSGNPTLWFEDFPGDRGMDGFGASRFRKIPPHKADEFDRETIALLNTQPILEPTRLTPRITPVAQAKGEPVGACRRGLAPNASAAGFDPFHVHSSSRGEARDNG